MPADMNIPDPDEPTLKIRDFAEQTGLKAPLLRIWERRFGWPKPQRYANRYRAYPVSLIPVLRAVREQIARGRTIGELLRDPHWSKIMDVGRVPKVELSKRMSPPDWSIIPFPETDAARSLRKKLEAALDQGDAGTVAWVEAQAERIHPRERGLAITDVLCLWQRHLRC